MLSDSDLEDPDKISKLNSNNNKRGSRRLLVRQQATAGTEQDQEAEITLADDDLETVSGDQVRDIMDTPDPVTPTQAEAGRVIYSETIDISPGSPGSGRTTRTMFESQLHQAARHSFVYGSARYLPKQYSQNSNIISPFASPASSSSSRLIKQQSLTATWSPSPSHLFQQHKRQIVSKQKSLSASTSRCLDKQQSLSASNSRSVSKAASPVPGSGVSDGSGRFLPKQYSCTSNSSAYLSPQNNSCSLVDIPTYLCYPVQLATVTTDSPHQKIVTKALAPRLRHAVRPHPGHIKRLKKPPAKKTQWTLCCVAIAFLVVCIVLVGTMLSYTSEYQDRAVARNMFYNVHNTNITIPIPQQEYFGSTEPGIETVIG